MQMVVVLWDVIMMDGLIQALMLVYHNKIQKLLLRKLLKKKKKNHQLDKSLMI